MGVSCNGQIKMASDRPPGNPTDARPRTSTIAAALKDRETPLRVIFENIADVVYLLDVESDGYRFVAVNPPFLAATGLALEQVIGRRVDEVIPQPSLGTVLEHYARALANGHRIYWEELSAYPAGKRFGEVMVAPVRDATGRFTQLVGTVHDVTQRRLTEARLHRLAHHDTLTGLPNRLQFFASMEKERQAAMEQGRCIALLYLDLDRFKLVNDARGHTIGDELLRQVADRILRCTRVRDTVGRFGGDEFGSSRRSSTSRTTRPGSRASCSRNCSGLTCWTAAKPPLPQASALPCVRWTRATRRSWCSSPTRRCITPSRPDGTATVSTRRR